MPAGVESQRRRQCLTLQALLHGESMPAWSNKSFKSAQHDSRHSDA